MVGRRRGDEVAVRGDLTREAGHGAGDLVDFAEEDDAGEAGARVAGDARREDEDSWLAMNVLVYV